ncbi:MAG: efflux RND transporter periplasmic adaptor subunit [Planctomycetota bacterium]
MKKILPKIPWFVISAGLIVLLVYGFWPQPVEVDLVEVQQGSIDVTVNDDGETRIREKYIVSAPVAGKMLRIQLHSGDWVEQNVTELLRIEPSDPSLLDARTRAEYEARVRTGQATLEQSKSHVRRTKEALELADHDYARAKRLIVSRAIARSEFDSFEHRQRIADADVKSAEFAVKVAQFELETAQAALAQFDTSENSGATEPVRLVSPIDGKVLNVFHEDASVVVPGTSLMELGDPMDLEIEIDVLSTDAVKIQLGDKVFIEHWGGPNPLQAIVRLVEPSAFLKVSALGVEEKRVNVIADFVDPPCDRETLGDGFRIEARIVIESTSEDAVKVASGALFRVGDAWFVYRVVAGVAEQCAVDPGQSNGFETEIKSGLSAGDIVILHPTDKIDSGVAVKENE